MGEQDGPGAVQTAREPHETEYRQQQEQKLISLSRAGSQQMYTHCYSMRACSARRGDREPTGKQEAEKRNQIRGRASRRTRSKTRIHSS